MPKLWAACLLTVIRRHSRRWACGCTRRVKPSPKRCRFPGAHLHLWVCVRVSVCVGGGGAKEGMLAKHILHSCPGWWLSYPGPQAFF